MEAPIFLNDDFASALDVLARWIFVEIKIFIIPTTSLIMASSLNNITTVHNIVIINTITITTIPIIITMMMMMIRDRAERRSEGMNEAFGAVQELQQAVRLISYDNDVD